MLLPDFLAKAADSAEENRSEGGKELAREDASENGAKGKGQAGAGESLLPLRRQRNSVRHRDTAREASEVDNHRLYARLGDGGKDVV